MQFQNLRAQLKGDIPYNPFELWVQIKNSIIPESHLDLN